MKNSNPINSEIKDLILVAKTRRTKVFAYGFLFAFVACTAFLAFNPSNNSSSPWFDNLFSSSSANSFKASIAPYKSQVSSLFSHLFPNSSSSSLPQINATYSVAKQVNGGDRSSKDPILGSGSGQVGAMRKNQTQVQGSGVTEDKKVESGDKGSGVSEGKEVKNGSGSEKKGEEVKKDGTQEGKSQNGSGVTSKNHSSNSDKNGVGTEKDGSGSGRKGDESKEGKDQSVSGVTSKNLTSTNEIPGKGSGVSEEKPVKNDSGSDKNGAAATKDGSSEAKNQNESGSGVSGKNQSSTSKEAQGGNGSGSDKSGVGIKQDGNSEAKNQGGGGSGVSSKNQTSTNETPAKGGGNSANAQKGSKASSTQNEQNSADLTSSPAKSNGSAKDSSDGSNGNKTEKWIEDMVGCDIFNGQWVKDDSYPLYPEGSCPHIDEPFDCYLNRRPDRGYQKLRWQPHGCNIPRLNATDMLERLRGKRLVFVGDSLNRNMWESLVCVLRNSVKDKKKVFEASGRHEFRTVGSYSFLFKDYKATVEFFRSPFLVQEWEMHSGNATKETLRLDIIERSSSKYKDAHLIVFNTGHWWTHEKTSKGKDYYQEGNRVYGELNVVDAFHKALNTWAKWVDANVNPKKTLVFFRGYSASHFSGGQWNSGGACDKETEPIKNEHYLSSYPTKMSVLETVIKGMKTPVNYLNITRMTDYRKDAHPSVYRKQNLTEEERKDPLRFQDCSHWCLPGVPDSWNELLYAQLIIRQYQMGL